MARTGYAPHHPGYLVWSAGAKPHARTKRRVFCVENLSVPGTTSATAAAPAPSVHHPSGVDAESLVRQALPLVGHVVRDPVPRITVCLIREAVGCAGMRALAGVAAEYRGSEAEFVPHAAGAICVAVRRSGDSLGWALESPEQRGQHIEDIRVALAGILRRQPDDAQVAAVAGITTAELSPDGALVSFARLMRLTMFKKTPAGDLLPAYGQAPVRALEDDEQLFCWHGAINARPEQLQAVIRGHFLCGRPESENATDLGLPEPRIYEGRDHAPDAMLGGDRGWP